MKSKKLVVFAVVVFIASYGLYTQIAKEEFCTVIDDLREVDSIKIVNLFDESEVAYFVDLQNSYQILVQKSHVQKSHEVLLKNGIDLISLDSDGCRFVR